jgi:glycosyltransferase involved in cell wall biosynthesis
MINYLDPNFNDSPGRRPIPRNFTKGSAKCDHVDVSIITPYYNTGELFLETFVSVQAQSLQNWEWIIVDDGSPDDEAVARLHEFAKKDARIKVIRQVNGGTAAARNTGFSNSSGRYICLLDHDDMIEPTYLEKCVWFLDSNTEFAFCNSYSVVFGMQNFLWTTGFERGKEFLKANSGPPISVIRKTAYVACGGFDATIKVLYEDWDFWLAMAKAGFWGYTIPEYLQWYRKLGAGRYEQILESGYDNNNFAKDMQQKYKGLDAVFPAPIRRSIKPYEIIETRSLVTNPLTENHLGRRIMFILPWMVTGGADRVNLDLIEGLIAKGHDVTICTTLLADNQWEYQYSQFTPDIFVLPNILHKSDYARFLAYLIESRQIDSVVITGSTIGYQLLPYLRAVSPKVSFVDMCHVEEPDWLNGGHPRFAVGYQDLLDLNIVTTKHLAEWMVERGADDARIKVMYSGVRPFNETQLVEVRNLIRTELNIPLDLPVIVFAGRICAQKRPALLAQILKTMRDEGLTFQALILGDGDLRVEFESLLKRYDLTSNVTMFGSVPHPKWLDILAASDILLMPSQYEGISIALIEAMAAGVVPVVAKVGGQDEVVSKEAGMLIARGGNELNEYLDAIRQLLLNPKKLIEMSKSCKLKVMNNLSWDDMVDNFSKILDEAHRLKIEQPRNSVGAKFGCELASQSIELERIASSNIASSIISNDNECAQDNRVPMKNIIIFGLSRTWLGGIIIRNRYLKSIAQRFLRLI